MNPNNCFPNHIYWINKSPRPFTTYIYTYYPTIHKSKYSHSTMSWSRNYRLPTQTKKLTCPLPSTRNSNFTNSNTYYY
ncbi:hypothetical protein BV338_05716 [Pseudomonas syringae pv. actinidiae]|nr:hypothetical protein BV331_05639 [Pseudomonas syringae pv. actinidiae]CES33816.1 Uncharacterised protein [Salmonella enterica subsp. enterica serovar Typhi]OSR92699.1 hypothetical protein BV332_05585 [Pseudomonas syringae pv. actinidiae]OSS23879.1 hypothetical protein BV338_05716 [Pseudomonas syringae pv. actinidiae]CGA29586.1 Uncharacterised protein [Salmonella enterica subsp. enterica serovar Typhi]